MTKEVWITIKGIQLSSPEEEPVIMTAAGTYHLTNGKHYIHYEEDIEGSDVKSKNTIKISERRIILMKKGIQSAEMIFDLSEPDRAVYETPYGNLSFQTETRNILLNITEDKVEIQMEYSLYTEGEKLSDNRLNIKIESRTE